MPLVLYLFGSGGAFFLGVAAVLAGFFGRVYARRKWIDRAAVFATEIGLVLVVLSAVPLPYALYALAVGLTITWLATEKSERPFWKRWRKGIRCGVVATWLLAIALELPYQFAPSVSADPGDPLHVIGDSISAGLGDDVVTWPNLLAERGQLKVYDCSRAAATTSSALAQAQRLPEGSGIVVVEIGGNDLLSGTSPARFPRDLDLLLATVRQKSDRVLMFELPLPPLCNEYGRAQRALARKHQVRLIPKRLLMSVLAASEGTTDTIHLSQGGQERMAAIVESLVEIEQTATSE